jgi:hypothetical protein
MSGKCQLKSRIVAVGGGEVCIEWQMGIEE